MADKQANPAEARRRGIQSVEIGLRVLKTLAGLGDATPLGILAQACGMSAPQVHRYLQSLIAEGMVQQSTDSGRYDLGPAALALGLAALARVDAFHLADAAITDFSRRTGLTIQIAALGPLGPTIIRWIMGRPPVMTSFNVGTVLPLLNSATGRLFLAFMPDAETAHLLQNETQGRKVSAATIAETINRVREDGYAHVEGSMVPGLRATAFPIFNLQGRVALTATVLLPEGDGLEPRRVDAAIRELRGLCCNLSEQLGWRPTDGNASV